MADAGRKPAPEPAIMRGPHADIVDADSKMLPRAAAEADSFPAADFDRHDCRAFVEGMDMLRKPEAARPAARPARGGPVFWVVGLGLAPGAFWVSGGHALVRQAPLRAVEQAQPSSVALQHCPASPRASRLMAAGPVLFVDGKAVNDGAEPTHTAAAGNRRHRQ